MAFKFFALFAVLAVASAGPQYYQSGHESYQPTHVKNVEYADAPATYDFNYSVHDDHTGDIKQQHETAKDGVISGQYSLIDADGFRRIVDYTADDVHGFNAEVRPPVKYVAPAPQYYSAPAPVVHKVIAQPQYYSAPAPVKYAAPAPQYYSAPAPVKYVAPVVAKIVTPVVAKFAAPIVAKYDSAPITQVSYIEYEEPANYEFNYSVHDEHSGDIKQQQESAKDGAIVGQYSLIDADGYRRIVDYTADDHHGFNAQVRLQKIVAQPQYYSAPAPVKYTAPVQQYTQVIAPKPQYYSAPAQVVQKVIAQPQYYSAPAPAKYAAPAAHYSTAENSAHVTYSGPSANYHY
ncbi:unnamed protein product [Diamesa serratosioi]